MLHITVNSLLKAIHKDSIVYTGGQLLANVDRVFWLCSGMTVACSKEISQASDSMILSRDSQIQVNLTFSEHISAKLSWLAGYIG